MPKFPAAQPSSAIDSLILQLRKKFPEKVDADVLRKLQIAPNNESYIINALKFVGLLDEEGRRIDKVHDVFVLPEGKFQSAFAELVKVAYSALFDLHGDDAWTKSKDELMAFFRTEDKSSELVGKRQADTFLRFANAAGKVDLFASPAVAAPKVRKPRETANTTKREDKPAEKLRKNNGGGPADVALSVKIEVNLPAVTDQAVYDAIFQSIRKSLIQSD